MLHSSYNKFLLLFSCIFSILLFSCSTPRRLRNLEKRTDNVLQSVQEQEFLDENPEDLRLEDYKNFEPDAYSEHTDENGVLQLNLQTSLELAARYSREYQSSKESLYSSALSLLSESDEWDWNPVNNFNALWGIKQKPSSSTLSTDSGLGIRKRFFSGARLSAGFGLQTLRYLSGDKSHSLLSLANINITQPLLAGYGADIGRETLTQAERNLVYALRTYIRTREALLINIAERYYAVLNAKESLEIGKQTYASVAASLERSEAMADAGRVDPFQVDQARQKVLTAESNLVSLEENYQNAIDLLKTVLGMPLDVSIDADPDDLTKLTQQDLPVPPMSFEEAIETALDNRLDFATVKDRLDDQNRKLKVAEDALKGKLDLVLGADAQSKRSNSLHLMRFADSSYTAGLNVELPLHKEKELIQYKRQLISLQQQHREINKSRDGIIAELRNVWRLLRSYEQNYEIQKVSVDLSEKRVESTQLLFEGGRVGIRELLDAQDDLSSAKNSLTRALVNHRICWLKLLYQMGQLPINPDNLWSDQLENK